jgi:hypothetical protein
MCRVLGLLLALAIAFFEPGCAGEPMKGALPWTRLRTDPAQLHNVFALGTNLFSGSSPESAEAFAALARLGVKTLISVDGAKPHTVLARKFGMKYVHLPHGYDGISTGLQLRLAKAARTLEAPIYIHCHHGEHRGPAAAAVICMSNQGWTRQQAESWLMAAGTSTNYAGLYESVRTFKKPSKEQLEVVSPDFPEVAEVSGIIDAMVSIDQRWEHLKAIGQADYKTPASHPDIQPANEAVVLWEHFREIQRFGEAADLGSDFLQRFQKAELEARDAEKLLRLYASDPKPDIRANLDKTFELMGRSCASCHKLYRDVPRLCESRR